MKTSYGFSRTPNGEAVFAGMSLQKVLEQGKISTPAYIYDLDGIELRVRELKNAFGRAPHLIAYAIKANSAASILKRVKLGGAGIDAVSGGELQLALKVGVEPQKIVLSGVAKQDHEIALAIREGILALQAESKEELRRIAQVAQQLGLVARVSMRINPSVLIDSHEKIATGHDAAKFGIAKRDLAGAYQTLQEQSAHLSLVGISTHVGSMLKEPEPYLKSAKVVCDVAHEALSLGHCLEYVDFGGGFGIDYGEGQAQAPSAFAKAALALLNSQGLAHLKLVVEPGRSIVGPYGVLVSKVIQSKSSGERRWLMLDAGMNDLMRPALYGARHRIEPLSHEPGGDSYRVVGPVCESTDDFGDYPLGAVPKYVAIRDAGAYGFTMANEYNARPLPAEVFVSGGEIVHISHSLGVEAWLNRRLEA